jgi:hypothetical protein
VAATPQLTLTSAELARVLGLLAVGTGTDSLEQSNGSGGLADGSIGESGGRDDERNLGVLTLWPRAMRRAGLPEAASADAVAKRFWFRLIFWCHLRQTLVGANMRPERHMLPNAA